MNIEAALKKRRIPWSRSKGGAKTEYRINCPFCAKRTGKKPDTKKKLYMNPAKNRYNCFRCGAKGMVSRFLKDFDPKTVRRPPPEKEKSRDYISPGTTERLDMLAPDHAARRWLRFDRGFDPDELGEHFDVRYCRAGREFTDGDSFYFNTTGTLIFPVSMGGEVTGWQSRPLFDPEKISDSEKRMYGIPCDGNGEFLRVPKYFSMPGMGIGSVLYNYDNAKKFGAVVVAEGPLDVCSIGLSAIGTFGKGISERQTRMIKTHWDLVIIMLDPGDADEESKRLFQDLAITVPVVDIDLEGADDPGDADFIPMWTQIYEETRKSGYDLSEFNMRGWSKARTRIN